MNWRGTATATNRVWASLPYLLPLVEVLLFVLAFNSAIFRDLPLLSVLFVPLLPILRIYTSIPFVGLIVFFLLLFLVVRNTNIDHFVRFNTMQAILLDIILVICRVILQLLGPTLGSGLVLATLANTIFLGIIAAVGFSLVQTVRGVYAEIPTISDAVHMQVR
ncbi:hypothetical protein C7271_03005 [filamentous cyanobacterium CCP5]|nr:hypothetical protein C7271_03005 [filamentous cyanobacterium CCP5]